MHLGPHLFHSGSHDFFTQAYFIIHYQLYKRCLHFAYAGVDVILSDDESWKASALHRQRK